MSKIKSSAVQAIWLSLAIIGVTASATSVAKAQINGDARLLQGLVVDDQGLPVANAQVTLRHSLTGSAAATATQGDGKFSFSGLARGTYRITANAERFAETTRAVEVGNHLLDEDLRLVLRPAGVYSQITIFSGSRVKELQEDSPQRVEAITRQQILSTGYERVSDILSEIPGVVTRSGSTANVGAEQVQGIDSRQVLILQDGLPIVGARGIKRGAINLNRQSIGSLERVEVVKGAASPLFGSDAIGGVINMISREPTAPLQGSASVSGGTLGSLDGRFDIGTRWKALTAIVGLEHHEQDSYTLFPSSPTTVGPDWRRNDLFWRSRYAFSPRAAISFHATAYHNREEGRNVGETGFTQGLSNDSTQNYALIADFVPTASTTLQLRGYSARYDENSRLEVIGRSEPPAFANLNERYKRLDGTVSQQLGSRQLLQAGYEWTQNLYRGANRLVGDNAGQQITANDVWLQDRIQLTSRATLTFGGRVTSHSLFGTWAVPKVGLVVRLSDNWIVRGSFGRGFRAPDLGQLYFRFANPASFYQVIGNPNLQPETSRSFSTGVQYKQQRFRLGVNLYRNDLSNLIDSINAGFPRSPADLRPILDRYGIPANFNPLLGRLTFVYVNFGRVYTQGFEVDGEVALSRFLRVQGAYTYVDAVDDSTGLRLPQRHRHQGFAKTEYQNTKWGLLANLRGTFFSHWLLDPARNTRGFPYALWDVYASKQLPSGLTLFSSIDNLGDSRDRKLAQTPPTYDRPDYGRMFRIGLRYTFARAE